MLCKKSSTKNTNLKNADTTFKVDADSERAVFIATKDSYKPLWFDMLSLNLTMPP